MDIFSKAKVVRLRSQHDKYLLADDDDSVIQDRNGASREARWTVEFVQGDSGVIRLKSCYGRYLTASNKPYLLGLTGHKVIQDLPVKLTSSVEWIPVRDGMQVKLRTRYGNFLRANGGTYPYKNSVTHDKPQRTATRDWVLWDVDVIEVLATTDESFSGCSASNSPSMSPPASQSHPARASSPSLLDSRFHKQEVRKSTTRFSSSPALGSNTPTLNKEELFPSIPPTPRKPNGRIVHYYIADVDGNENEHGESCFILFEGSSVKDLMHRLEEETGIDGVIVCTHNVLNGELCPLHLQLPPNNADMQVVVVPPYSKLAESFVITSLI